jgi:hypothetical protein
MKRLFFLLFMAIAILSLMSCEESADPVASGQEPANVSLSVLHAGYRAAVIVGSAELWAGE